MKKGFIISSAVMVFVFAVVVAIFMFVLNENELHNTAITGLAVEEVRWLSDAGEYYCSKYVNTTSSWSEKDAKSWVKYGYDNFSQQFKSVYTRTGNKTSFSTGYKNLDFLDFFEPYGGFNVTYYRDTPPYIRLASPAENGIITLVNGEYNFSIFSCDTDNTISELKFWLFYRSASSPSWNLLQNSTGDVLAGVPMEFPPNITANLTQTGLSQGGTYWFKAVASDGQKNSTESIVCNVQIS